VYRKDQALSEVIGFVLILAIITAAFSLYLVYGVPVQGRESEINHMANIKDQFISYKIGVDSLWTNHQTGIAMTTSFPLGTAGQTAQGSSGIIPVMQPIGSSGTLMINQRTATPENFTITSQSLVYSSNQTPVAFSPFNQLPMGNPYPPSNLTVYIDTGTPATISDLGVPYGLDLKATPSDGISWEAIINLTPRFTSYNETQSVSCSYSNTPCTITYMSGKRYTQTDLTITVLKGGVKTLDGNVIYSNVQNNPGNYSINILDDAYGLKSVIRPLNLVISSSNTSSPLASRSGGAITYQYLSTSTKYSVPLGALTYTANNNYWISQTYYYQIGGVFLSQTDGITYKLPPAITFSNNGNGNITVNIVALAYDTSSSGAVGGASPAQISTFLKPDSGDLPYAAISPNTWTANINITTPDPNAVTMWKNYFNEAANQTGGIPSTYYSVGTITNGSYISLSGINDSKPHITLKVTTANLTANLQAVGSG